MEDKHSDKEEHSPDLLLLESLANPNEDCILETVTDSGVQTAIQEVQHILDVTTVLMVPTFLE